DALREHADTIIAALALVGAAWAKLAPARATQAQLDAAQDAAVKEQGQRLNSHDAALQAHEQKLQDIRVDIETMRTRVERFEADRAEAVRKDEWTELTRVVLDGLARIQGKLEAGGPS